jgi:hypothetical protein
MKLSTLAHTSDVILMLNDLARQEPGFRVPRITTNVRLRRGSVTTDYVLMLFVIVSTVEERFLEWFTDKSI